MESYKEKVMVNEYSGLISELEGDLLYFINNGQHDLLLDTLHMIADTYLQDRDYINSIRYFNILRKFAGYLTRYVHKIHSLRNMAKICKL